MSAATTALVHTHFDRSSVGDMNQLSSLVAPEYPHHNNAATLTLDQFKRGAAWISEVLPDRILEVVDVDVVAERDRVAVRWVLRGTHLGSGYGEPPSGKTIVLHGQTLLRIEDGRIAEDWEAMDEADLRTQLGAMPGEG